MKRFCFSLLVTLLPSAVFAQVYVGQGRFDTNSSEVNHLGRSESPQNWAFELKLTPFLPPLDQEFGEGGATPFGDIFGNKPAIMVRAELDYQIIRIPVGSLGVGFGAGLYRKVGNGLDANGDSTEDENVFRVIPLSLEAVFRADILSQNFQIPLVPFAKAGLDSFLWSNSKNGAVINFPNGNPVRGSTNGFHGTLGLAIDLNPIDPKSAVSIDQNLGVNHSYIFAEATVSQINDFGSASSFDFSSVLVSAGIALEF